MFGLENLIDQVLLFFCSFTIVSNFSRFSTSLFPGNTTLTRGIVEADLLFLF